MPYIPVVLHYPALLPVALLLAYWFYRLGKYDDNLRWRQGDCVSPAVPESKQSPLPPSQS